MVLAAMGLLIAATIWAASGIDYNGTKLDFDKTFTRTQCGTMKANVMPETSGLACSRTTPGYLWAHGDENLGDNRKIVAVTPEGTLKMTVKINSGSIDRDDWEDICTGTYDGKNYIFLGAIGDNDLAFKDSYYIFYFEEPAITSGTQTVTVQAIRYGYPDNKAHNTETLMYDNVEQVFYIADKVKKGICTLYSLPFRTDYDSSTQTVTKVTELGNGEKFNFLTGGDITPDGHWMAIKSKKYVLLWERQGAESLSVTAKRNPVQIEAYEEEAQGEALAWLDNTTFFTTSDQTTDMPIYQYTRPNPAQGIDQTFNIQYPTTTNKVLIDGTIYILRDEHLYTIQGTLIR